MSDNRGWYGVDLDGTLAEYHGWVSPDHIGDPIPAMVLRVRNWLGMGFAVKVFTARAFGADDQNIKVIQDWTEKHIGVRLPVTCQKDYGMIQLWDDRAVEVEENTGIPATQSLALDALAAETQAANAHAAQLKAEAIAAKLAEALRFYATKELHFSFDGEQSTITCDGGKIADATLAEYEASK